MVGETPNLAARLQALADAGAVVVSETTRRQIGALFELGDLGAQALKGFAEPQRAWRVLSENRALGRFEALRSGATPLIGRDEELDLLLRRWAQAKAGSGRVVLISAEPGVGKSRLAEALAERAAGEPHVRLRYFCSPHHQDRALYPIIAQMERAAGFARGDAPGEKLGKLQAVLAVVAPPIEDVALLAEMLSLPATDIAPPLDVTPQRKKEKTFEELRRQIERLSSQQPLLMVFEDIHWIDPSTRELLDRTIERIATGAVLLVATFRPEFQPPWTGQPHVTTLALTRLDRRDTAAMIANIAGNAALPAEIMQEIAERTDGVPLFVEELTKAVLESGTEGAGAQAVLPHSAPPVPATLHASLMARLDRLGTSAKEVAQKGSVIGREFSYEVLAKIADMPEPQLRESLDRLVNSGLLFARGTPSPSMYQFKHALVQDTAYGTLLRRLRQELHRKIAEALEAHFPETLEAQPELLAHHFAETGLIERAVRCWLKAGQQMLARSGMAEGEALLRKGLTSLAVLPDSAWRQQLELDLHIALGRALIAMRGHGAPTVGEAYARARQLSNQLDQGNRVLPILFGQWTHHLVRAELNQAQELAAEMRETGETYGDAVTRVIGFCASGWTSVLFGDLIGAQTCFERGLSLYDPMLRRLYGEVSTDDQLVALLGFLSVVLVLRGYLDQARLRRDAALAEARRLSHAHTLAHALNHALGTTALLRSEARVLLQYADELLTVSTERGYPAWHAWGLTARGWCLAALGYAEQGIPLLTAGLGDLRAIGNTIAEPTVLNWLADAYRMAGQSQVGLVHLIEAERVAEATQVRCLLAETFRLRGDLLIQGGHSVAAEASYHEAIALALQQRAKLFELRASTSLARLWRDQGKVTGARDLLAPVYNWFTEGFDAADLVDAKALLDELG